MSTIIVSLPEKRFWSWQLKNREKDFWSFPFLRYMLFYKQHSDKIKILNWQRIKQKLSTENNWRYSKKCAKQVRLFKWGYMICGTGGQPGGGIDYMDAGRIDLRRLAGCLGLAVVFVWDISLREEFGLYL